jgi:hypothetical protein
MWEARILSAYEARATSSFGNIPLIVIARDPLYYIMLNDKPERPEWEPPFARAQMQLTDLSTNATFLFAHNIGHQIPQDNPRLVVSAVVKLVDQARTAAPQENIPRHLSESNRGQVDVRPSGRRRDDLAVTLALAASELTKRGCVLPALKISLGIPAVRPSLYLNPFDCPCGAVCANIPKCQDAGHCLGFKPEGHTGPVYLPR